MTTTWRRGMVVLALVAAVLWTAPAFARGGHGGWGGMSVLHGLDLTDAQKTQVHQIFQNHRPQFRTLGSQMRTAQQELTDKLYGPDPVTPADLAPLSQQISQLRDQLSQERLKVAMEIRGVLTPDQLAKATQIRQQLRQLRSQERTLLHPGQ